MKLFNPHTSLFLPLICAIVGIALCLHFPNILMGYFCAGLALILCTLLLVQKNLPPALTNYLTGLLMIAAGYCLVSAHNQSWQEHLNQLPTGRCTTCGIVTDLHLVNGQRHQRCVTVDCLHLHTDNRELKPHQATKISCYVHQNDAPTVGDHVQVHDIIIKPTPVQQQTPFYYYLRREDITQSIFDAPMTITNCSETQLSWLARWYYRFSTALWHTRDQLFTRIHHKLSYQAASYSSLMFFGNKYQFACDDMRFTFSLWGLSHFLARAGLHIVLFIMWFTLILRFLPLHATYKDLIMFILCAGYDALSWANLPFIRAWYAAVLTICKRLTGRHVTYLYLLCLNCFAVLFFNPYHLLFLDFQLTYAITFAFVFLGKLIAQYSYVRHDLARKF